MKPLLILCTTLACAAGVGGCASNPGRVHESLLTLDTHLDAPMLFSVQGWDITQRHSVQRDGSQVDLPRMIEGGLDGGFWAIYIPQGPLTTEGRASARAAGLRRMAEIQAMVEQHPDKFAIALTADDAPRIAATGKRIVYLSMENGYPLGEDPTQLRAFFAGGVRMAGPVHFLNNDLGTSATDGSPSRYPGLTPLGKQWVQECNRLGILIDASHSSDTVLDELLELSTAPIILSHSGARAVFDHPRNVDDAHLRRIAAHGGVIQVSAYNDYMIANPRNADRQAAIGAVRGAPARTLVQREASQQQIAAIDQKYPYRRATFDDYMQHLLHVIRIAGVEHAGIGIDFDGGGGVQGFEDAGDYPKITARLLDAGYSRDDLQKIWSGNVLRVLRQAQAQAQARDQSSQP
ncbi:MAG: dipeptidase [Pseudomonadota bacterium]